MDDEKEFYKVKCCRENFKIHLEGILHKIVGIIIKPNKSLIESSVLFIFWMDGLSFNRFVM